MILDEKLEFLRNFNRLLIKGTEFKSIGLKVNNSNNENVSSLNDNNVV